MKFPFVVLLCAMMFSACKKEETCSYDATLSTTSESDNFSEVTKSVSPVRANGSFSKKMESQSDCKKAIEADVKALCGQGFENPNKVKIAGSWSFGDSNGNSLPPMSGPCDSVLAR